MAERRKSQIKAEREYDSKRPKKPVSFRLGEEDMDRLDKVRGERSRADFALSLILKAIEKGKSK